LSDVEEFQDFVNSKSDLKGLNVTIPYKESVIPFLDELDEISKSVGAVNTIKIKDGKLHGFNTDVYGFQMAIKPFLASHHERALILGTGGASKAVAYVLRQLGIEYIYVSRTPNGEKEVAYSDLNAIAVRNFPMIINTSPLGMFPKMDERPAIPYEYLSEKNFLVDLIYNPEETLFLKEGKSRGALCLNGLDMLKLQAEKSWEIWNED